MDPQNLHLHIRCRVMQFKAQIRVLALDIRLEGEKLWMQFFAEFMLARTAFGRSTRRCLRLWREADESEVRRRFEPEEQRLDDAKSAGRDENRFLVPGVLQAFPGWLQMPCKSWSQGCFLAFRVLKKVCRGLSSPFALFAQWFRGWTYKVQGPGFNSWGLAFG